MDKKFIMTNKPETRDLLKKMGFHEVSGDGKTWFFLNNGKLLFANEVKDIYFTDKMYI